MIIWCNLCWKLFADDDFVKNCNRVRKCRSLPLLIVKRCQIAFLRDWDSLKTLLFSHFHYLIWFWILMFSYHMSRFCYLRIAYTVLNSVCACKRLFENIVYTCTTFGSYFYIIYTFIHTHLLSIDFHNEIKKLLLRVFIGFIFINFKMSTIILLTHDNPFN